MDREQMQRLGFIGLSSLGAVLLAFVLGGIMLAATGHNPFDVYGQMFSYGFQTPQLLDMALAHLISVPTMVRVASVSKLRHPSGIE